MAKGRGSKCPNCGRLMYRDKGSYLECTECSYIGWGFSQPVSDVGKGRGNECPNCSRLTLHAIVTLPTHQVVRRCSTCSYTGIEAPPPKK